MTGNNDFLNLIKYNSVCQQYAGALLFSSSNSGVSFSVRFRAAGIILGGNGNNGFYTLHYI